MKGLDLRRKSLQRSFVCVRDPELTERKKLISSLFLTRSLSQLARLLTKRLYSPT